MTNYISNMRAIIHSFGITDFIDILLVTFLLFFAIRYVRETRAIQLLKGVLIFVGGSYALAKLLNLRALSFLINKVFNLGVIALLIVLQPELRHTLEQIGRTRFSSLGLFSTEDETAATAAAIHAVGEAAEYLSKRRIGALIVFERATRLGEIVNNGTVIDAVPSAELIGNIFFVNSPLHDGALIIRDGRLHAAGCYLPLSENYTISKEMGTRHRAGLGMSENSDAVVVIVSEETGIITIAENGHLRRGFTSEELVKELERSLLSEDRENSAKKPFWRREAKP